MAYEKVTLITDKNGMTRQVQDPEAARANETYTKTEVDAAVMSEQVAQTETTVTIYPNKLNVWATAVSSLTVSFATGTAGRMAEYMLQFTVGADNFTLTLPNGVRWVTEPEWTNGSTYQVSIVNNLAVYAEWEGE